MEPKFDQLLSAKIKRLGKSIVETSEAIFSNANSVGQTSNDIVFSSSSHTYHPNAVKVGDKNYYQTEFGKVYTGEIFRGLIIITNKSSSYALTNIELTVQSTYQQKGSTKILSKDIVAKIDADSNFSKIIEIRTDFTDTYVI